MVLAHEFYITTKSHIYHTVWCVFWCVGRCKALYVDMGHMLAYELMEEEDYNFYWIWTGIKIATVSSGSYEIYCWRLVKSLLYQCADDFQINIFKKNIFLRSRPVYIMVYFSLGISNFSHQNLLILSSNLFLTWVFVVLPGIHQPKEKSEINTRFIFHFSFISNLIKPCVFLCPKYILYLLLN